MASKLVISCDQCGTETTNDDPHAHPGLGPGALSQGWTELRITTTEPIPPPPALPLPAWARDRDRDVIDAEFEPDTHVHLMPVGKSCLLCPACAATLAVRVGDVAPKMVAERTYGIVGPGVRARRVG